MHIRFFDSRISMVYCDNTTEVMCVVDVIFGQEGLAEQWNYKYMRFEALLLWQRFSLYNTVLASKRALRFQCTVSVRAFSFCTWRRSEAVSCARWVGTVGLNNWRDPL